MIPFRVTIFGQNPKIVWDLQESKNMPRFFLKLLFSFLVKKYYKISYSSAIQVLL